MRYKAPEHTSEIFLSVGPFRVSETGTIRVPKNLPSSDVAALCAAGFTPLPPEPKSTPAPAAKKG